MTDETRERGFTTAILHGDRDAVIEHGAVHKPLHLSVAYGYRDAADLARKMGFSCGFEVPSLPEVAVLNPALEFLDFMTINELEWGETNAGEMRRRGLVPDDLAGNAVRRSRAWAAGISRHPKVYFCSSRDKDSVQLRKRLIRTARTTARDWCNCRPSASCIDSCNTSCRKASIKASVTATEILKFCSSSALLLILIKSSMSGW